MQAKSRRLSQLAAIGATVLLGIMLSGCSLLPGSGDSNSSDSNRNSESSRDSDREGTDRENTETDTEESNEPTSQSAFEMRVGDCWNDPPEMSEVQDLEVVPCTTAHDNEVFALLDLEDGAYPGKTQVESLAQSECEVLFEDYVGTAYLDSSLEIFALYPTEGSWNNMDDREVVCSAYDLTLAQLSVSVEDSGL